MVRRLLKAAAVTVPLLVIAGAILYLLGVRVVLDGGGGVHLRVVESEEARAERIARHRSAQRADPAPPRADPGGAGSRAASPASAPAAPTGSGTVPEIAPAATPAVPAGLWPDFRGPKRDGHYTERAIRTDWPAAGLTPMWKQPVGGGFASFVVARGRAFTIEQRGGEEIVAAYDILTGRELWTSRWAATFSESMGGPGPRATPTWSDGRVYALGAAGEFRALDETDGRTVWRTNILEDAGAGNIQWGMSAAPLVVDETVVVLPGGANGRSVVAYDRRSGKRAWSALDDTAVVLVADARAARRGPAAARVHRIADGGPDAGHAASCSGSIPGRRNTTSTRRSRSSSATTACSSRPGTAPARRCSS